MIWISTSYLRRYRLAAGLSQEELAERAGLSARGISDLESSLRQTPQRQSIQLLARALALDSESAATGETASALIDARLVLEAKRLLAHSDAPAAETAAELGFPDASYFGRFFRRHTEQSLGAFRAAIREKYQRDR